MCDDLIGLGYKPGPVFKKILEAVDDLRLEGQLHDKAEALAWLKTNWPAS